MTDISYKLGGAFGEISADSLPGSKQSPDAIGGILTGVAINYDFSTSFSHHYQGQILIDITNNQVLRVGAETGLAYHLLGASRRHTYVPSLVYLSSWSLSVSLRGGIFNYTAVASGNQSSKIKGQVLEFKVGGELRFDISSSTCYGAEAFSTLTTIASSVDRVNPSLVEMSIYVRKFLY